MKKKYELYSDLTLIFVTLVWGISFPLIRNAITDISDQTYLFYRFLIAALCVLPLLIIRKNQLNWPTLLCGTFLGGILFLVISLTVTSLKYSSAINVAFFTGSSVALVPLFSIVLTKSKVSVKQFCCVLISVVGVLFLIGKTNFSFGMQDLWGASLAVMVALQIVVIGIFSRKSDPLILGTIQIISCSVISTFYAGSTAIKSIQFTTPVVIALLITGVLSTAFCFTAQTIAQKYTTPLKTSLIFTGEPVFGALFALIIPMANGQTEHMTAVQLIGCALILTAMLLSEDVIVERLVGLFKKKAIVKDSH